MAETNWSVYELRVRYAETDQMGVVYHANYLTWFEIGRTEMIRQIGITYEEVERRGLYLPLTEAQARYYLPAKYDDLLEIRTCIHRMTGLRLEFYVEIWRDGQKLADGLTKHVWLDKDWKPVRLDKAAPDLYERLVKAAPFRAGAAGETG